MYMKPITMEEFEAQPPSKFKTKMRAGLKSDKCVDLLLGCFEGDELLGAIATKQVRHYSNLKWVMCFKEGRGAFRFMCEEAVRVSYENGDTHFRVSINPPALGAYQAVGFKYWGIQKSDCYLSIGQITGPKVSDLTFFWDEYIEKEVTKTTMGGCVKGYSREAQ